MLGRFEAFGEGLVFMVSDLEPADTPEEVGILTAHRQAMRVLAEITEKAVERTAAKEGLVAIVWLEDLFRS